MKLEHRFPDLELSYETYAHKKVLTNYDICLAIPNGKKLFAWFTYDADAGCNAVYFVDINKHFKICKLNKTNIHCDSELALQTILYGTLTDINEVTTNEVTDINEVTTNEVTTNEENKSTKQFFIVEDVYYYKGLYTKHLDYGTKLYYLHAMFNEKRVSNMFALPYMCMINPNPNMLESLLFYESICNKTAYTTHHIQFRSSSSIIPYLNHTYKKKQEQVVSSINSMLLFPRNDLSHHLQLGLRNAVFKVKADIQADIYHLYAFDNKSDNYAYINIAYIGSYSLSKYMNSLFRNIQENNNIDYGEESEDEDTFQNVNPDKYVDLSKEYFMNCVYHPKFKKWVPVNVASTSKCVDLYKLIDHEESVSNTYHKPYTYNKSNTYNKHYTSNKSNTYNKPYTSNKSNTNNNTSNKYFKPRY